MKHDVCHHCTDRRRGYPAGPQKLHVCTVCRRVIRVLFGLDDPSMVLSKACDACFGKRWGKMKMTNNAFRDTPCPVCDGAGAWFALKSPLILLAECSE